MRSLRAWMLMVVASFLGSGPAQAACGLSIVANPITIAWDTNFVTQAISFTLTKADALACPMWVGFTKGGGASAATRRAVVGANQLTYQLYKEASLTNILKDSSDAAIGSVNEVISDTIPAGINAQVTYLYYFNVPVASSIAPTIVRAGVYTDSFTLNVYEGADPLVPAPTPVTSAAVAVSVTVPEILKTAMVPTGGGFEEASPGRSIDFGVLQPGQARGFDFRVRTNAGFDVTFSSANNGKFKPPANPASPGVSYQFYANGVLLDLSNSAAVPVRGLGGPVVGDFTTGMQGAGYPIRIVVGSFAAATVVGGDVEDTITVTTITL